MAAIRRFDKDGDGRLGLREFKSLVQELCRYQQSVQGGEGAAAVSEQVRRAFALFDKDGSGG
eukprot:666406-Pleurochrysis_carterae.AAC.1